MGKAPAFQMYAQDFDMDTAAWSNDEVGIYTRLLNYEWINGSIPSNLAEIARIVREPYSPRFHAKFTEKWMRNVAHKFAQNGNGNLINRRMEEVRQNQLKYSESRRKNVSIRYKDKPTYVDTHEKHMDLHTPLSSSSSSSSNIKTYMQLFDKFWKIYPSRNGRKVTKKESLQCFKEQFKSESKIGLLLQATENYSKSCKEGFAKDPIRFLKKDFWRDWLEKPEEPDDPYANFERIGGKDGSQNRTDSNLEND